MVASCLRDRIVFSWVSGGHRLKRVVVGIELWNNLITITTPSTGMGISRVGWGVPVLSTVDVCASPRARSKLGETAALEG